jgi:VWFA-related protein
MAGVLLAQQQAPSAKSGPQEPFVLRTTTKLVQVNVVAVDKRGNPVDNLKPGEFELLDKGKTQKLSFFDISRADTLVAEPGELKQNIFSNRLMKAGTPASVMVILLDGLNTAWADQTNARGQVLKFLSTIQPTDRVALYSLGRGLRILHDFTTDSAELIAKLNKYRGENLQDLASSAIPESPVALSKQDILDFFANDPSAPSLREAEFFTTRRVLNTLGAMEAIASHLAGLPGRKSIIWVSGSFPLSIGFGEDHNPSKDFAAEPEKRTFTAEMERTVRLLNHAGVAVYPVDARGLMTDPTLGAETGGVPSVSNKAFTTPNLDAMIEMASRTGGRAFYHRNDIEKAVRMAAEDGRVTYTLGYYPTLEPDDRFHEIKVKVTRPGVTLRFRRGYYAYRQAKTTEAVVKTDMAQAMWSPLDATALAINARVDLNTKTDQLEVIVQVDPSTVTIEQKPDRWTGRLDFGFTQKDEEWKMYSSISDALSLNLMEDSYRKMAERGLMYRKKLGRDPKAKYLRVVTRDSASGLTGSITVPLKDVKPYTPNESPNPEQK